jgi:hypothetical protein
MVGGDDFFVDLLFHHRRQQPRYVVVELKAGTFKSEHAGQLSFHLTTVDAQVRMAEDGPPRSRIADSWRPCRRNCKPACRASSKSSANWPATPPMRRIRIEEAPTPCTCTD